MLFTRVATIGLFLLSTGYLVSQNTAEVHSVRLESGVSGHIHPSICVCKSGALVAVYCKSEYKPCLITRSTDGGMTWSKPSLFPHTVNTDIYPGSLTTLADGKIVHMWNVWFKTGEKTKSRHVAYSVSSDDGITWSKPENISKNRDEKVESVIRHPFIELSKNEWLLTLMDRTVVYNPVSKMEKPFGDGRKHGLVPIVKTMAGTLISGTGLRSTDGGKQWSEIKNFPDISTQGWRHEMLALEDGLVMVSQIPGPGIGGDRIQFVFSQDDGKTWNTKQPFEFYNPQRAIGGRACPRTVLLKSGSLGTIFYDTDPKQVDGSGVFYRKTGKSAWGMN